MSPPILPFTLALVGGLAAGLTGLVVPALGMSLVLASAWAVALLAFQRERPRLQVASLLILTTGAGALLGRDAVERAMAPPLRAVLARWLGTPALEGLDQRTEPVVIEGRLRSDALTGPSGVTLRLDVDRVWLDGESIATWGGVSVGVGGVPPAAHVAEWREGRRIRAPALLGRPARYMNPGVPDQERAAALRGIALVGVIKSAMLVDVVAPAGWWGEWVGIARIHVRSAIDRHVGRHSPQSAAVATAILIGDRRVLDEAVERRLQEAGTYHVIAISGGNIAILSGLVLVAAARAGWRGRAACLATIAVLAGYASVTAGGASVARATVMAIVYLAVRAIDHRVSAAAAIALTGSAVLVSQPLALFDVGLWFTFGATAAIVYALTIGPGPGGRRPLPGRAATAWACGVWRASVAVEICLAPVSAFVFQRVTLAGLVLNFAALPAMAVVQVGAMAVVAADGLGWWSGAQASGWVVHLAERALTDSASLVDLVPWATWRVPSPSAWVLTAYYAALAAVVTRLVPPSGARRTLALGTAGGCLFWILLAPQVHVRPLDAGRLHVTMFDVGQGDATLVVLPRGQRLLVDAGGLGGESDFDVGERVVAPALRARQIVALDYLAVTHGDPDHVGGAAAVLRDFAPKEVWWGVPVPGHAVMQTLRAAAADGGQAWRTLQRGDRLEIGDVEIRVHHPPLPDWERQRTRNDDSLVLEIRYGDVSVLLTGDISRSIEHALLPALDLRPTVVLKVAHHGSATSSDAAFIDAVRPAVALIGVGRGNRYGHPTPAVLARLRAVGAAVYRTDIHGAIDVSTDGLDVVVATDVDKGNTKGTKGTKQ